MENTIFKTLIYDKQVRLFFVNNTKLIVVRYKHWQKDGETLFTHSQDMNKI